MAGARPGRFVRIAAPVALTVASAVALGLLVAPVTSGLAPVAIGEGTVIDVPPLDSAVGVASAEADEGGASSEATTVRVAGIDVGSTRSDSGGPATDDEDTANVPVPLTSNGNVKVAPRTTSASSSPGASRSESHSDALTARIPGLVEMEVLSSDAEAVWTPGASSSRAQVDGATVNLGDGDLVVVLMHAEESSDGRARLYLIRINNAVLFGSTEDRSILLKVPDIFTIELAATEASGGVFTGEVVDAGRFDDTNFDEFEDVIETASGSTDEDEPAQDDDSDTDAGVSNAAGSGTLPITGSRILVLILSALTLVVLGAAMTAAPWLASPLRS